jgi:hypothetical protein
VRGPAGNEHRTLCSGTERKTRLTAALWLAEAGARGESALAGFQRRRSHRDRDERGKNNADGGEAHDGDGRE